MKHIKFGDFLILCLLILLIIFVFISTSYKKSSVVHANGNGKEYVFSLENDGIFEIQGSEGITSIQIENHKVRIIDSPCPNKTCINQGWGKTIVCLPNNVIVTTKEAENGEGGFDEISQ